MKRKILWVVLSFTLLVVLLFAVVFGGDFFSGALDEDTASFAVEIGDGTLAVAAGLKEKGIIGHEKMFSVYAMATGYNGQWQAGTFEVEKGMGYGELCKLLTTPRLSGVKVTIPEGKQVRQIAKILESKGICSADAFMEAANTHSFDYSFLEGIDHENPLEGYLFPDTYYFEKNTDPDAVIKAMLDGFEENLYKSEYIDRAKELGYTFDEMIILSSIVESEASSRKDRENVAGVFFNRLNNPDYTKLQSCVTVEYAMGVKKSIISYQDTLIDSPYNTYMYPGLPVGPICCPGTDSVEATLYYADNDYYYFQSDERGRLHFAETYEEHAAIQNEVQATWKGEVIEDYNE
ncbi:MAG: endolytic transglycosylase MltG [Clostridia bacterium]